MNDQLNPMVEQDGTIRGERSEQPFAQGDCIDGTCYWLDYYPTEEAYFCRRHSGSAPRKKCSWAKSKPEN